MSDRLDTVSNISRWTGIGVKLPKPLAGKLAVFDSVRYVETGHQVDVDTSTITTANADQAVAELAARLVPATADQGKRSPLDTAKLTILNQLAVEIIRAASDAVPEIIDQLRPTFERAVSVFTESVGKLPDELTSEALVAAGPDVLTEYHAAREAAATIHSIDGWIASLADLAAYSGYEPDRILRVLAPSTRAELVKVSAADRDAEPLVRELGESYLTAVELGVEFKMNTPQESAELREELESQPVASTMKFLKF
jgi:hypothetical protein